jgi:D-aminopeptidase
MSRPRVDGIVIGGLEPGPGNSIADAGVTVGHVTVERTGVTAVVPRSLPLPAGTAVLNGAGELTGSLEIREWGLLETPVYLTATHAVGRVYDGAVSVAMAADPRVGVEEVVIPVVGECDDSWLSDARVAHVQPADVGRAVSDATADFEQGAVGAGSGMSCFGWKGGIGSSSRRAAEHTVGVLLLTNFGSSEQLRVDGVPVGELLDERPDDAPAPGGSCLAVVATDATLIPAQLERM